MALLIVLLIPVALILLEWGADAFTDGIAALGERTRVPETLLGLLTAGIEWEELAVVVLAVVAAKPGIAIGDIIGANIANIAGSFSLGLLAAPVRTTPLDRRFGFALLAVTAIVGIPLARGTVARPVGAVLLVGFVAYLGLLVLLVVRMRVAIFTPEDDDEAGDDATVPLIRLAIGTLLGLVAILLGAEVLVIDGVRIASFFGVPDVLVGLTLVAFGTTLPDKLIAVVGARRGRSGVVIANTVGSNACNLLGALGLAALIRPLAVDRPTRLFDLPVLLGTTALLAVLLCRARIGRWAGAVLLTLYVAYLVLAAIIH
jgi:cation:H+ antiporter